MPRQAAASAGFATGTNGTRMLLKVPDDLDEPERTVFADLIAGSPASHFLPADAALLGCLAKAIVLERVSLSELRASGYVSDRPSPWLDVWKAATRNVTTLSRMLSLSPASRVPSKAPEAAEPLSFYSRMALEAKHGPNGRPEN
jgi:hypothetical protein